MSATCNICMETPYNLREFMLTTVIMTSGACRTQGRSAQKLTKSGREPSEGSEGSSSGSIIWMHRNNGFSTLGRENDVRISYKFDFQGRIYLKVEICVFEINQNIDYQGRIYLKVETRIFTKIDQIFEPPQGGPKSPQGAQRAPQDLLRTPILYTQTPDQPQSGRY